MHKHKHKHTNIKQIHRNDSLIGVLGGNPTNEPLSLYIIQDKQKVGNLAFQNADVSEFSFLGSTPWANGKKEKKRIKENQKEAK